MSPVATAYHNPMVGIGGSVGLGAPMSNYGQTPSTEPTGIGVSAGGSIDGTPTRVATLVIITLAGIALFKWGNIKFNIAAGG